MKYKFEDIAFNITEKRVPAEKDYATYIGLEHMDTGSLKIKRWGSPVPIVGEKLVMHKGDILLGKRNAYLRRAAIAPHDGVFSAHGMILRPKTDVVDEKFFPLFIASDHFFDKVIKISVGSLSPTINWKDLKDVEFYLPDMQTQKRLANILWSMEKTIDSYEKMIELSDELVKSQFIEMFGDPNIMTSSAVLTDAFDIRDDLRKPLNDAVRAGMHNGTLYPYYGANGQVDSINIYLADYNALCLAEDCGSYGAGEASSYIILGKAWVNNHAHVLVPKQNCNLIFGNEYFRLLDITKLINGSTRAKLTQEAMKKLPVLLPPIEEQEHFAQFVELTDKSKFEIKQALDNLQKAKKKIINEALKG